MSETSGREGLHAVTVTAFMGPGTDIDLEPPHDYTRSDGSEGTTGWTLIISNRYSYPVFTLHARDVSVLWELHDLIAATIPPRAEGGGSDA